MSAAANNIEESAGSRDRNNFDLLRLTAALLVVFSHAYVLMQEDRNQVMLQFAGNLYFLSSFGLMIFFTISGYLVSQSLFRSDSIKSFAWKRILRIYPAYIILTLLTVFLLGPVFTSLPARDYFSDLKTWRFLAENILITDSDHVLPGVFNGSSVNASAWTLSFEIKLYLILLGLFVTGILRNRWLFLVVYVILVTLKILFPVEAVKALLHINPAAYYDLGFYFLTGAGIFLWRKQVRINLLPVLVAALAWFIFYRSGIPAQAFEIIFFSYLVLWLGLKTPPLHFPAQDISYGIYIYGWPVQIIVHELFGGRLLLWQFNCITIPIIILLGLLSWNLVEKNALSKKEYFSKKSEKGDLRAWTLKT